MFLISPLYLIFQSSFYCCGEGVKRAGVGVKSGQVVSLYQYSHVLRIEAASLATHSANQSSKNSSPANVMSKPRKTKDVRQTVHNLIASYWDKFCLLYTSLVPIRVHSLYLEHKSFTGLGVISINLNPQEPIYNRIHIGQLSTSK